MSPGLKKWAKRAVMAGAVVGIGIQFIPVRTLGENPTEDRYLPDVSPEVMAILRESCMDCHSNETVWPAYTMLAPGSWLMSRDVRQGRNKMNISEWGDYDAEERSADKEEAWEQIEAGEMPPWFYVLPMHMGAKLTDEKKAILKAWLLAPEKDAEGDEDEAEGEDEGALPTGDGGTVSADAGTAP